MNIDIIYEYIKKITKEDIWQFGKKQGLVLEQEEVDTIYNYIKNDTKRIFNNPNTILKETKNKLKNKTYEKLVELYNKYKTFIN